MKCKQCNEEVEPQFAFCESCGHPLNPAGAQAAGVPAAGAPHAKCACGGTTYDPEGFCDTCGRRGSGHGEAELCRIGERAASATHRGRHHRDNQDAVKLAALPAGVAMGLADGVSSASHARQAADIALDVALETLRDTLGAGPKDRLEQAVRRAHQAVCGLPNDVARLAEPQTTLVLALVEGDQVWYAWVGDSRLYALSPRGASQLTVDDSSINEQLAAGVPLAVAQADADAHCITQCLGMRDDELDVHLAQFELAQDTWLLLCSDGLWNYCSGADQLWALLNAGGENASLSQRCASLVDYANQAGGQDNITVALYRHGAA